MEQNLTNEQLNELFASDPQIGMELSAEEMEAWYTSSVAEAQTLNDLNPYNNL